ncbi:MAG TPA: hypothetical protein VEL31_24470 [Ktedonobacteraceae bacterium]|nr:hypothetical protein [Ktedonobacteraceae bacterium]
MFNGHPARSTDYKVQAIEEAAQEDAAPHRAKNEQEACYSEAEIAQLAEQGSARYAQGVYDDAETAAARDVYEIVFRAVVRRAG